MLSERNPMLDSPTSSRQSEVQNAMSRLESAVNRLTEFTKALALRLEPVLRQQPHQPEPCPSPQGQHTASATLAIAIDAKAYQVSLDADTIESLLGRCEL